MEKDKEAKLKDSKDSALIVAALGIGAYILYKSGAFGLLKKTADAASTVIDDAVNLPENLVTLGTLIPQLPMAIAQAVSKPLTVQSIFDAAIQGKVATFPGSVSINQRTANMIHSVFVRYPGVTSTNWSQIALSHHAVFDANGFIISDDLSGGVTDSQDLSYLTYNGTIVKTIVGGAR